MIKAEVLVPLLNANEPEARLVEIHVKEGQEVAKGALLLTIETTKAAADVEAPEAGCVRLLAEEGAILEVGERLALITETADEPLDLKASAKKERASADGGPRLTKPARVLAEQLGLDLASLPSDRLLTEEAIRQLAGKPEVDVPVLKQVDPGKTLLIYGGGGHAKTVMEMARALGTFKIAGIIDDGLPAGTDILGIPVLGPREILPGLVAQGVRLAANGVGGIVDIKRARQVVRTAGKPGLRTAGPGASARGSGGQRRSRGGGAGLRQCLRRLVGCAGAEVYGQHRGDRLARLPDRLVHAHRARRPAGGTRARR